MLSALSPTRFVNFDQVAMATLVAFNTPSRLVRLHFTSGLVVDLIDPDELVAVCNILRTREGVKPGGKAPA